MKPHGGSIIKIFRLVLWRLVFPVLLHMLRAKLLYAITPKSVALYAAEMGCQYSHCNSIHPAAAILTPMWDAVLGEGEERYGICDPYTRHSSSAFWRDPLMSHMPLCIWLRMNRSI